MRKLGKDEADKIEWSGTRLLCIAADFTCYDGNPPHQVALEPRRLGAEPVFAEK
jgi:hypothetical protein